MPHPGTLLEISDLIVDFDPSTLQRIPVPRDSVTQRLRDNGQRQAADIVAAMPTSGAMLDPGFVDQLLIRVHCEMQRLSEEFQHGRRVLELLLPMLTALQEQGVRPPFRVVDIGCGTGYVMRWLAAHQSELPEGVELLGVDFNDALVARATQLAAAENLSCTFLADNAFTLEQPSTIFLSTGVIHHFRGTDLAAFFQQHAQTGVQAFAHFDFQPTIFAPIGAWLFHWIRMREPLSLHDGVVSARRAHHATRLLEAARNAECFRCGMYSRWVTPGIPRVMQAVVGIRDQLVAVFRQALGVRDRRLEERS